MALSLRAGFGTRDLVLLTLDALRLDVAEDALERGLTPNLAALVGRWERRTAPATFTLPAHEAIFAGFFPTPPEGPTAPRPVAVRFPGSRSLGPETLVLDASCVVRGYRDRGYHAICIGGTSFFDPGTPMGASLTARFDRACWSRDLGVASPRSPWAQVDAAVEALSQGPVGTPSLLFVNLSATHPPTRIFARGAREESTATQSAALAAIDAALPPLLDALRDRGGASVIVGADHGTCFGEDGRWGHRIAHPKVWEVPWAEVELPGRHA